MSNRTNTGVTDLLLDVEASGGAVSVEQWKDLGARHGYTPARKLNGFFGGVAPSMRKEGDLRVLTDAGGDRAHGRR